MKTRDTSTPFLDLIFNMMAVFMCLFALTYIFMSKKIEKDKKITAKAEFIISYTWPSDCSDDVDAYVEDPIGNLVFFRRREEGLMHLDRDDLGSRNDTITLADGTSYVVEENREIITIRGIIPGEYIVNAHMYLKIKRGEETLVKVKLEKLNPEVRTILVKEIILRESGDEATAFRFIIDKAGDVTDTNELEKKLAVRRTNQGYYYDNGEDYDE